MQIQTKPYGEIEIDESKVITVYDGLLGFENHEKFAILGSDEEKPFKWLQSIEEPSLAFVICQASIVKSDYELSILQEDYDDIELKEGDDFSVYLIIVVPENPEEMTVNFKGPVVINQRNYLGKQVINQVEDYGVRHRLLDELEDQSILENAGKG